MKRLLLATLLLLLFTTKASAQEANQRFYDCDKTGKCLEGDSSVEALYANNLIPGVPSNQEWFLSNNSNSSCRVYLRLKSLDNEKKLPNRITLSAVGKVDGREEKIIKETKFAKLLKKQSIYLGKLPPHSIGNINWSILLDESVSNNFQASEKKFSTLLYSYCLHDKKGQVAGASTQNSVTEKLFYMVLSLASIFGLVLLKKKSSGTT